MKVLFVCNNIYTKGNGICTSARVTVKYLREHGVDACFLAGVNNNPKGTQPEFPLRRMKFPLFQPLIDANGFCFAVRDRKIIRQAVEWADVIHIEEPFRLQKDVIRVAKRLGKPVVGTFHLYPQNIFYEIPFLPFLKRKWANDILLKYWRDSYFNKLSHVQCPTNKVKEHLENYGFKSKLHVISNGIRIPDTPVVAKPYPKDEPIRIISVGRFSQIKGQTVLLEAMKYSRNADRIQLIFAGKGTLKDYLEDMASQLVDTGVLTYPPRFAFYNRDGLKDIARNSYLYIHNAKLEVEGLGCSESLREGTVPVIAEGDLIATSDFALDERSRYPVGNAKALAAKIDWWIEHPEERDRMAQAYADKARDYDVNKSIDALVEMYEQAIAENDKILSDK